MYVLDDQGEGSLPEVGFARLAYGARRWIGPERLVVSAAIVVASETESAGRPQDQHGGCYPDRHPCRRFAEPGIVPGFAEQLG